jgi:hypothetical protein
MTTMSHHTHTWPQCWWTTMHSAGLYTDLFHGRNKEQQAHFTQVIRSLCPLTPCADCSQHMRAYIMAHPLPEPSLFAKDSTYPNFFWTVDFHNNVSKRIGNPVLSRQDALHHYKGVLADKCPGGRCSNDLDGGESACDNMEEGGCGGRCDGLLISLGVVGGLWALTSGALIVRRLR